MNHYLLHIVQKSALNELSTNAEYAPSSLQTEGFIHLCTHDQLKRVVALFYPDPSELYLAIIAPAQLQHSVVYERSPQLLPGFAPTEEFPHYYHALNTQAIIDVVEYSAYQDFAIPPAVVDLLSQYRFKRLPVEGTLYRETWRSAATTAQGTPVGTAMLGLFCPQPESVSRFHQLAYDEVWHHYAGDPLELHLIAPDGETSMVVLGQATATTTTQALPQFVVPAGYWQAGRVVQGGKYALYGCTMAPGFHVECFSAATAAELTALYPNAKTIITELAVTTGDTQMHALPD